MKIRIGTGGWHPVILFDPPSRTVTLGDGSVWHLGRHRNEILELDIFISRLMGQYAPWEVEDRKTLVLSRGEKSFPEYQIETEADDPEKYEMYYFYKFLGEQADFLSFPDFLLQGVCVRIQSAAARYFLADTLFFDYLLSRDSAQENVTEIQENLTRMNRKWRELGAKKG
jgi:hypothetical protein